MRIVTMLLITLFTGAAGIGAWMVMNSELPPAPPGKDAEQEKTPQTRTKWRDAPYVILAPAKTLPEEQSSAPPPPPEPAKPEVAAAPAAPSPAPRPASITTQAPPKTPPATEPPPAAPRVPAAKSSIAKLALETVIGPQAAQPATLPPEPQPKVRPAAKPVPQAAPKIVVPKKIVPKKVARTTPPPLSPPAAPASVKQAPAGGKKKLQLPYETRTKSRPGSLQKQQSLLTREQTRFRRSVPLSSGTLKSGNTTISLAGLDALAGDASCTYASGKSWECGRWGKYALRRLIRGRSIACDIVEQVTENIVTARCSVAGVDINNWVIRRGWGRPKGEGSEKYDAAFKAAKNDRLGQWSIESVAKQN